MYQKICAIYTTSSAQSNREMARHVTDHIVVYDTRYSNLIVKQEIKNQRPEVKNHSQNFVRQIYIMMICL